MKHLGKFLSDTADQMLSTFVLAFFVYAVVKGGIDLFDKLPDPLVIGGIAAFGFILGIIKFFTDGKITKNLKREDDVEP